MPESSETPAGNVGETPPPPAPPFTPGDEAQFEDYVRGQYDSIAGQSLNVVAVTLEYMANLGIPRLLVDIGASDTDNVFASQPAAVLTDYGRRLLGDTKLYFGDQYCAVTVKSTYKTANGNACVHYPGWCHVVDYNESADTWTVSWTYVWANATRGPDNIVAWNAGQ